MKPNHRVFRRAMTRAHPLHRRWQVPAFRNVSSSPAVMMRQRERWPRPQRRRDLPGSRVNASDLWSQVKASSRGSRLASARGEPPRMCGPRALPVAATNTEVVASIRKKERKKLPYQAC